MAEMNRVSRFFVNTFAGRRNRRRWEWLRTRLPPLGHPSCLEIGCGNGDLAARIVDGLSPGRYVATDIDPYQIETARRHLAGRYPAGVPSSLELDEADMLELPYPDSDFDVVFAYMSIHHANAEHHDFTNTPTALKEIDRVLRPAALLVYEEFVNKERLRAWLREQGYTTLAEAHRWNAETVIARKPTARAAAA
jgi:ubiquinone/menaquinone biosynthesis C-methylase UbiE